MSTTEQKALYADRNPRKLEPHYTAHVMAMTREDLHSKSDIAAELGWRDQEIEALRAQVEALTIENQALWTDRSTLQSQRDAFLEAGLRARYLLVRDRDAADEAHTGTDGEIDADGARAVAEFNAVIAYIDSAVEGGKKVQPTPSSLPRPVAPEGYACCNSWFASLPEGRQAVLRDDKWMLAHAAFDAGRAAAPQPPGEITRSAIPEEFLESPDIPDEDSGLNTYYSRELVLECIAAALAAAPQPEAQPTEAAHPEAQPVDWERTRRGLAMLILGLAGNPRLSESVAEAALDSATEPGMPLAYLRPEAAQKGGV